MGEEEEGGAGPSPAPRPRRHHWHWHWHWHRHWHWHCSRPRPRRRWSCRTPPRRRRSPLRPRDPAATASSGRRRCRPLRRCQSRPGRGPCPASPGAEERTPRLRRRRDRTRPSGSAWRWGGVGEEGRGRGRRKMRPSGRRERKSQKWARRSLETGTLSAERERRGGEGSKGGSGGGGGVEGRREMIVPWRGGRGGARAEVRCSMCKRA